MESLFLDIGLEAKLITSTLKNKKVCTSLEEIIRLSGVTKCDKKIGTLLYNVATTLPSAIALDTHKEMLVKAIATEKVMNPHRYALAIEFLKANKERTDMESLLVDFEKAIGVGIEVTEEDIKKAIQQALEENAPEVDSERYTVNLTKYLKMLRERLVFAEAGQITKLFQAGLADRLGPVTDDDKKMKEGLKKKQSEKDK